MQALSISDNQQSSGAHPASPRLNLLEYDTRFSVLKEFVYYDFNTPFNLPGTPLSWASGMIISPLISR